MAAIPSRTMSRTKLRYYDVTTLNSSNAYQFLYKNRIFETFRHPIKQAIGQPFDQSRTCTVNLRQNCALGGYVCRQAVNCHIRCKMSYKMQINPANHNQNKNYVATIST